VLEYRRRRLKVVAERWPDRVLALCRSLCSQPLETPEVLAWAVGAGAESSAEPAQPAAVEARLDIDPRS